MVGRVARSEEFHNEYKDDAYFGFAGGGRFDGLRAELRQRRLLRGFLGAATATGLRLWIGGSRSQPGSRLGGRLLRLARRELHVGARLLGASAETAWRVGAAVLSPRWT